MNRCTIHRDNTKDEDGCLVCVAEEMIADLRLESERLKAENAAHRQNLSLANRPLERRLAASEAREKELRARICEFCRSGAPFTLASKNSGLWHQVGEYELKCPVGLAPADTSALERLLARERGAVDMKWTEALAKCGIHTPWEIEEAAEQETVVTFLRAEMKQLASAAAAAVPCPRTLEADGLGHVWRYGKEDTLKAICAVLDGKVNP